MDNNPVTLAQSVSALLRRVFTERVRRATAPLSSPADQPYAETTRDTSAALKLPPTCKICVTTLSLCNAAKSDNSLPYKQKPPAVDSYCRGETKDLVAQEYLYHESRE